MIDLIVDLYYSIENRRLLSLYSHEFGQQNKPLFDLQIKNKRKQYGTDKKKVKKKKL